MRLGDLDALKEEIGSWGMNDYEPSDFIDAIDNAQTVDVKDEIAGAYNEGYMCGCKEAEKGRLQGEWGKHGECPFCSYVRQWEDDKFCGNCGAKLRGKEEND